jgi:hypothetical protein
MGFLSGVVVASVSDGPSADAASFQGVSRETTGNTALTWQYKGRLKQKKA